MGGLIFNNSTYACTRMADWDMCDYKEKQPVRYPFYLPPNLQVKYPWMNEFIESLPAIRARVMHHFRTNDDDGNDLVYG